MTLVTIAAAIGVAVLVSASAFFRWRETRRREGFLPALLGVLGLGLTAAGVGAKVTGLDQQVQKKMPWGKDLAQQQQQQPQQQQQAPAGPAYTPSFAARVFDGVEWSCPDKSIDIGVADNARACVSSQFHNPVWKSDGKTPATWGWNCPAGSVATDDAVWEKKCEMGWTQRVFSNGAWVCPGGTVDTGNTWDKNPGRDGAKQCQRTKAYTQRVFVDNEWACPAGTTDTGRTWGQPGEWNQCKWVAP
jgi:hypothetical protein